MVIEEYISNSLSKLKLEASKNQLNRIYTYLDLLSEKNKSINLTGTKNKEEILVEHLFDSLSIFQYFHSRHIPPDKNLNIIDVGTGGGLPGIPLAVFLTSSNIILLDSRIKICIFLNQVVAELKLKNAVIVNGRAELLSHESGFRENFDLVVSRALGNVRQVSEITVPFCKTGGRIILYKSKKVHEEINEAKEALNILSAETEEIFETDVPDLNKYRVLLVIKKLKSTLYKYPRKYAKMLKKPLP